MSNVTQLPSTAAADWVNANENTVIEALITLLNAQVKAIEIKFDPAITGFKVDLVIDNGERKFTAEFEFGSRPRDEQT